MHVIIHRPFIPRIFKAHFGKIRDLYCIKVNVAYYAWPIITCVYDAYFVKSLK